MDVGDALFGAMVFGPMLNPPTYDPSSASSDAQPVNYGADINALRREIAELRRNLDVAFMILVRNGLAPAPEGDAK